MIIVIFILFCTVHAGIKVFRKMCKLTDHWYQFELFIEESFYITAVQLL